MASRTNLGKWMITNGGEYDPNAVYERMTCVLYQNSTYLTLQTVTGVEPADDRVNYQLMAKGFAGSDFEIEGYVYVENEEIQPPAGDPLLNADKLGGELPGFYAPQHEISDAFSTEKAYAAGDYCIYLNSLYKFTGAKDPGEWDGAKVIPVTVAGEIGALNGNMAFRHSLYTSATALNLENNATVSMDPLKIDIGGYYMGIISFNFAETPYVKDSRVPYISFTPKINGQGIYTGPNLYFQVALGSCWDGAYSTIFMRRFNAGDTFGMTIRNNTGTTSSNTYPSKFYLELKRLLP